jgi:hypothetical protein
MSLWILAFLTAWDDRHTLTHPGIDSAGSQKLTAWAGLEW